MSLEEQITISEVCEQFEAQPESRAGFKSDSEIESLKNVLSFVGYGHVRFGIRVSNLLRAVFGFRFVECDRWFENGVRKYTREWCEGEPDYYLNNPIHVVQSSPFRCCTVLMPLIRIIHKLNFVIQ